MSGHPVVEAAAVALLCGWDPLAYVGAVGVDRLFSDAVLARAAKLRAEEMVALAEGIGAHVGNRVAQILG